MAEHPVIEGSKERWVWVAIILLPFVCLIADFFTHGFSALFTNSIDRDLYKMFFYPAMLCMPSLMLACIFFAMDFFTSIMFAFCLVILSYLPLHYFEGLLGSLKTGKFFAQCFK